MEKEKVEEKLRIKIVDKNGAPILRLTEQGELKWLRTRPTEAEFQDAVIYLFDLVFLQQARLFQCQQEILEEIRKDGNLIKFPH